MERWPDGRDSAVTEISLFCASYSSVLVLRESASCPGHGGGRAQRPLQGGLTDISSTTSATVAWRVTETDRNFLPVLSE